MQLEQRRHDHERHAAEHVAHAFHDHVDRAAVIALDGAVNRADEQVDERNADGQYEAEARAGRQTGQDVLTAGVRAEHKGRLHAVAILEVIVHAHAHDIGLGRGCAGHAGIGQRLLGIVVRRDAQAVIAGVLGRGRAVDRHEFAVLVQLRNALFVGLIPDVGVGLLGVRDGGIDDLNAMLVLPRLKILVFCGRQRQIEHAYLVVVVQLDVVEARFLAGGRILVILAIDLDDRVKAGLLAHRLVVQIDGGIDRELRCAVYAQPLDLGRQLGIMQIHRVGQRARIGRLAENRDENRIQHQNQYDNGRHDRAFVAAEANPHVLEIADRLRVKFLIVNRFIARRKGKGVHV